jgi:hypothetical protein
MAIAFNEFLSLVLPPPISISVPGSVPVPSENEFPMLSSCTVVRIVVSDGSVSIICFLAFGPLANFIDDLWSTVQSSSPLVFSPTRMITMEKIMPLMGVA